MSRKKLSKGDSFLQLSEWGSAHIPFAGVIDFEGNLLAAEHSAGVEKCNNYYTIAIETVLGAMSIRYNNAVQCERGAIAPFFHSQGTAAERAMEFHSQQPFITAAMDFHSGASPLAILTRPERTDTVRRIQQLQQELAQGRSYLVNFCSQTAVQLNSSPAELFAASRAPYTVWLDGHFLAFSPEAFVTVTGNTIETRPMKGTGFSRAELLSDAKEQAEHATVVDLLRNDLSRVAIRVRLADYRYLTEIPQADGRVLYQTSSLITGRMPDNWRSTIGTWLPQLLPAGSVTGAPKRETLSLIKRYEKSPRGFFTGIAFLFDGENFYSAVLIRYLDLSQKPILFRSGAGITVYSDADREYEEILSKVYIPLK